MDILNSATTEELERDYGFQMAQQMLTAMLAAEIISQNEFNEITYLNRASFQPYLVELMPKIT